MTLLQAMVITILYAAGIILPIGSTAFHWIIPEATGWETPPEALLFLIFATSSFTLLVHFRHDWASIISSLLKVILLWRKPRTLDERLGIFILLTTLPIAGVFFYLGPQSLPTGLSPYWIAASLAAFSFPMLIAQRMNRNQKNMLNWNWFDSVVMGIAQLQTLIPGAGRQSGFITAAYLRNYNPEATIKYLFLSLLPPLLILTFHLKSKFSVSQFTEQTSLHWGFIIPIVIISILTSVICINSVSKNANAGNLGRYIVFRCVLAALFAGLLFYKSL